MKKLFLVLLILTGCIKQDSFFPPYKEVEVIDMRVLWDNAVNDMTITSSSEAIGYEWDTALKDNRLSRVGRTTGITSEWLKFNKDWILTLTDRTQFHSGNINNVSVCQLASGLIFIAYHYNDYPNSTGRYTVFDSDWNIVKAETTFKNGNIDSVSVCQLASGLIFIAYNNHNSNGNYTVLNIDYSVAKAETMFNSGVTFNISVCQLASGLIFITYQDNQEANKGNYIVLNTDYSVAKAQTTFATTASYTSVCQLTSGLIFILYNNYTVNLCYTVLNTDYSVAKAETILKAGGEYEPVVKQINGLIFIFFRNLSSPYHGRYIILNIDYSVYQSERDFESNSSGHPNYISICQQQDGNILIVFGTTTIGYYMILNAIPYTEINYISILKHNLTSTAVVTAQGSFDNSNWTSLKVLEIDDTIIWNFAIAQSYPFYRLTIVDTANTDGYIEISKVYLGDYLQMPGLALNYSVEDNTTSENQISFSGQGYGKEGYDFGYIDCNFPAILESERAAIKEMWAAVKNIVPVIILTWQERERFEQCMYAKLDMKKLDWKYSDNNVKPWSLPFKARETF